MKNLIRETSKGNRCHDLHFRASGKDGHDGYADAQIDFHDHDGCKQCLSEDIVKKYKTARLDYKKGYLEVAYHFYQLPHECGKH